MADGVWRNESTIEMHAVDLGIRSHDLQRAAYWFDCSGIVSGADDNPLRSGDSLPDASDERMLTAIGDCLRIQNRGATKSPALPCGEVE